MTENQSQQNNDIQKEWYINHEKQQCRKVALEYASKYNTAGSQSLLIDAQEIYDWLIKDLK